MKDITILKDTYIYKYRIRKLEAQIVRLRKQRNEAIDRALGTERTLMTLRGEITCLS